MTPPLPTSDLHSRHPELITLPDGTDLHRFYTAAYDPIYFDRSVLGRFNAPDGSYGGSTWRRKSTEPSQRHSSARQDTL
ncbi:hypothetical protein AJ87_40610 [Rhizobium yanglingense]|nr:hypothetical protein AJ87_40610 [Rhizobium yanglingense]